METFQPTFICKFCDTAIPLTIHNQNQGQMGSCGCTESRDAWENEHRADMERRKKARGRRRA